MTELKVAPEIIFLEPDCAVEERCWCEHDQGPCDECGLPWVKYVRAGTRTPSISGQEVVTEAAKRLAEIGLGDGEFFVNGDKFDLMFAPQGTNFANAHKLVARFACGETAFKLPGIVAELLNAAMVSAVSLPQGRGVPASPSGQSVSDPSPDGLGHTATVPNADVLADMGRAAENELMSELGHYDAGLAAWKVLAVAGVAAIPDDEIDTSDIPEVTDWSGAVRGRFTASGTEARRAETGNTDSVHDDPVGNAETPKASQE